MYSKKNINDITDSDIIIDIREKYEVDYGTIEGSHNIPMNILVENCEEYLKKENTYHIMCQHGMRSKAVCDHLDEQGFNVVDLIGGYAAYTKKNEDF